MTTIDWQVWRLEFPSTADHVHMNHAGLAPLSRRVAAEIRSFADEAERATPSTYAAWTARVASARAAAARLIGALPEEIAFVQNTAAGLSLIAAGLPWREGDNVVAVADEYPSNIYPWWGLRRLGVETRLAARPRVRFGVDEIAAAVDAHTRVVAVSAVDWQSGFRTDLAALGAFCRERDIRFVVDGIQAVGALTIDVHACGIDYMAVGGHKWLLAPEGCGFLFVAAHALERVEPVLLGWKSVVDSDTYLPYHFVLRPDAAKFEPGTQMHLGVRAFGAAIELLLEIGPAAIEQRVCAITDTLAEHLRELGATVLSPRGPAERSSILTVALGDPAALHATLTRHGIVARQRMGGVRLAPHFYADANDIERVVAAARAHRDAS
ncbi:MAG TPA: aminotransferase class V-fold PLP-dependent enzyme [Candidatus Dormibacteraeota bacterium]|nr:aminotransferase class V-fold PLP-dependent enzyme [Candidatus Dormibacteraeota bacterium]